MGTAGEKQLTFPVRKNSWGGGFLWWRGAVGNGRGNGPLWEDWVMKGRGRGGGGGWLGNGEGRGRCGWVGW